MSRVLYLRSDWLHNVGNNFIDKGAIALLEKAGHDVDVQSTSCQDLIIKDNLSKKIIDLIPRRIKSKIKPIATSISESVIEVGQKSAKQAKSETSNSLELPRLLADEYDYVSFAGMRLTPDSLARLSSIVSYFVEDCDLDLIILGAGGASYSNKERDFVEKWLKRFEPQLLITRDPDAYSFYQDSVDHTFDGIDCAFYINDAIEPPKISKSYVVRNIDRKQTPQVKIKTEKDIIKTHHVVDNIPKEYREGSNVFLSSFPEEYLTIYANADIVITDRLHSCIPTLVYGNKCEYLLDAPKNTLFNRIGLDNVTEGTLSPPLDQIKNEKERQVEIVRANT